MFDYLIMSPHYLSVYLTLLPYHTTSQCRFNPILLANIICWLYHHRFGISNAEMVQTTQVENLCKDRALKAFSLDEKVLLGLWNLGSGQETRVPTHKISFLSTEKRNSDRTMQNEQQDSTWGIGVQNRNFANTNRALELTKQTNLESDHAMEHCQIPMKFMMGRMSFSINEP